MINQLIQEVQKLIPNELKHKLQTKEFRETLLDKYGSVAFLNPKEMKYPVYDENGFNCNLCYAAYLRANQFHETELVNKAKTLFEKNSCSDELNIHIGENQNMDLITFIDLFEYSLDDLDFIECV
jgi:hypothetical protein